MAFMLHTTDDGHIPAWEYLPCSAITPKVGMALTQSSGKLAVATGTTVLRITRISVNSTTTAATGSVSAITRC